MNNSGSYINDLAIDLRLMNWSVRSLYRTGAFNHLFDVLTVIYFS